MYVGHTYGGKCSDASGWGDRFKPGQQGCRVLIFFVGLLTVGLENLGLHSSPKKPGPKIKTPESDSMRGTQGPIPIAVPSHYCSNYVYGNKVAWWQDVLEVARPARTVHCQKLLRSSMYNHGPEWESLSKGRLWLRLQAKTLTPWDSWLHTPAGHFLASGGDSREYCSSAPEKWTPPSRQVEDCAML